MGYKVYNAIDVSTPFLRQFALASYEVHSYYTSCFTFFFFFGFSVSFILNFAYTVASSTVTDDVTN